MEVTIFQLRVKLQALVEAIGALVRNDNLSARGLWNCSCERSDAKRRACLIVGCGTIAVRSISRNTRRQDSRRGITFSTTANSICRDYNNVPTLVYCLSPAECQLVFYQPIWTLPTLRTS